MENELEKAWKEAYSLGPRFPKDPDNMIEIGVEYRENIDYSFIFFKDDEGNYWYKSAPGDVRQKEEKREEKNSPESVA